MQKVPNNLKSSRLEYLRKYYAKKSKNSLLEFRLITSSAIQINQDCEKFSILINYLKLPSVNTETPSPKHTILKINYISCG